jgi:hypothetical protein
VVAAGRWRARRQYAWDLDEASIKDIAAFILARAGLGLTVLSSSDTFTDHKPAFAIHPGASGAGALSRLLAMTPDRLFFRGGVAVVRYMQDSDPVDYAYGPGHAVLSGRYVSGASPNNRYQVYGKDVMAEAFDWAEVEVAADRLAQVHDVNLDTQEKAQTRADEMLDLDQRLRPAGAIEVAANCGQEMYDLLEVTDSTAGLSAAKRRVVGLRLRYSHGYGERPEYTHTIELGGG